MDRAARWLTGAALGYVAIVLAVALVADRPLGHDEAVYAVGARGLWSGDPADELPLHRSIGMRVLTAPGVALGGAELLVRLPFALIALGYLVAIYRVTRRCWDARAAALAVALVATNPVWQWRAAEALSDIPSSLALLGFTALCAGRADDAAHPRRWAQAGAAGALAAFACYLRYASTPIVAVVLVVAFVGDPARRRWLVLAAAVAFALLVPFLLWSLSRTGSPLGVLTTSDHMGNRRYYGEGLVFYLRAWPLTLAGPVLGAVAALGLGVGLWAWRGGLAAATAATRTRRLFATAALGQIVLLGWRAHGEARFVFFAMTALAIVGASWLAAERRRWRVAVVAVAVVALPTAAWTLRHVERLTDRRAAFMAAAAVIRADAAGRPCVVYATEAPMTVWYARCTAIAVDGWGIDVAQARAAPPPVYALEAEGLMRSLAGTQAATAAALGWQQLACGDHPRWCVWRAAPPP